MGSIPWCPIGFGLSVGGIVSCLSRTMECSDCVGEVGAGQKAPWSSGVVKKNIECLPIMSRKHLINPPPPNHESDCFRFVSATMRVGTAG